MQGRVAVGDCRRHLRGQALPEAGGVVDVVAGARQQVDGQGIGLYVEFLRHGLDAGGARQHRYVGLHGAQAVDDAAGRTGRALAARMVEDVVRHFAGDHEGDAFVVLRRIEHAAREHDARAVRIRVDIVRIAQGDAEGAGARDGNL